jgi:trehalose 6-phosphate phosphatase
MKYILSRSSVELLRQFAWSRVLLAFDYDGTLAPMVAKPRTARMRPRTEALLKELVHTYPCVVISGRPRADVKRFFRGIGLTDIVGNHGIEPKNASPGLLRQVTGWRRQLEGALQDMRGVWIEDKRYSVAVHYRQSRAKKKAREAILESAAVLGEARVIGGRHVVNILPMDAPHKGIALERERARLGCDTAIYVGDDETDEDAFGLTQPGQLLSIRVGARASSAAAYYIRTQAEIDRLLILLLKLRRETPLGRTG